MSQDRREIDEVYRPYLTTDETRYNEIVFVADYGMVSVLLELRLIYKFM